MAAAIKVERIIRFATFILAMDFAYQEWYRLVNRYFISLLYS